MRITVLGCGASGGVPLIGNNWGACNPLEPKNRRRRASILVEEGDTCLLIDTSPDLREQLLDCQFNRNLTAVLMTHPHADHMHGIDDLRSVNWLTGNHIDVFGGKDTLSELQSRFPYIFYNALNEKNFYKPVLFLHEITGVMDFGPLRVTPIQQAHGKGSSLGFRINDFAYCPDVSSFEESDFGILTGVKTWLVDCAREIPHPSHAHLPLTLEWIEKIKPDHAYLTHMDHSMDYQSLLKILPPTVKPAYDGMVIEC